MHFNNLRTGKRYTLKNHGETFEFTVEEILLRDNFKLRDLHTLEYYEMADLIRYGKGEDFELDELR